MRCFCLVLFKNHCDDSNSDDNDIKNHHTIAKYSI